MQYVGIDWGTALGRRRSRPTRLAADQSLAPALHPDQARHGKAKPAKSAVARKVLTASCHARRRSSQPHTFLFPPAPASSTTIWPPDGPNAT